MTIRFRKKVRRMRGSHTHGWGSKKKHRGGGSHGGKGMAGLMKQKKSWMIKYKPEHFGRKGFKIPPAVKKKIRAINLREVDALARKMNRKEIDLGALGFNKVLGGGKILQPLKIKAKMINEAAKKKIAEEGGEFSEG